MHLHHHPNAQETGQAPLVGPPSDLGTTVYYFKVPGSGEFPFSTWLPIGVNAGPPSSFLEHVPGVVTHTYFPNDPPPGGLPPAPPNLRPWINEAIHTGEKWIANYWTHGLEGYLGLP